MIRVAGLDLSLRATGLALPSGELRTLRTPELHRASKLDDRTERIRWIVGQIGVALGTGCLAVVEGPAFARSNTGTHESAGLWWSVVVRLHEQGNAVAILSPHQLKKLATGKGSATKPDMRVALLNRTGLDVSDDNQVDAWWLRTAALVHLGHPDAPRLPLTNLAALDAVQWPADL